MTMFRVVPDQLRISEGWVRCGQCDEIFDAAAHMQVPSATSNEPDSPDLQEVVPSLATMSKTVPVATPETVELSDDAPRIEPTLDVTSEIDSTYSSLHTQRSSDETIVSETFIQELTLDDERPLTALNPEAQQPSFMQGSQATPSQRKPWVRVGLYLCVLLFSLGLLGQVLIHERDRIAAIAPEIKPVVETLCDLVQCTVAPLRQIESVVMDSSSFNKLPGDVYRLNFTLKNTAQMAMAVPAIELSLTDAQDQPLMRRVIFPAELGFKGDTLASVSESSASLTLAVKTQGGVERIAGYRVLAFYP